MRIIDQKIRKVKDLVLNENLLVQKIDTFKEEFENLIYTQIEHEIQEKLQGYQKLTEKFEKFFNYEELGQILDRKADMKVCQRLQQDKVSKVDFQHL